MRQCNLGPDDSALGLRQENSRNPTTGASRREVLKSLAMVGAGAILSTSESLAQLDRTTPGRIDVHHHMTPPFYLKAMEQELGASTRKAWTPTLSLAMMDKAGVATAMLSPVLNVVRDSLSDRSERARSLARQNNEYGAQVVKDHPNRFGLFRGVAAARPRRKSARDRILA